MTRGKFFNSVLSLFAPRDTFFDLYSEIKLIPSSQIAPVRVWNIPHQGIKVTGVYLNGVRLCYITDYTIVSDTIVLNNVYEPEPTDLVLLQISARN